MHVPACWYPTPAKFDANLMSRPHTPQSVARSLSSARFFPSPGSPFSTSSSLPSPTDCDKPSGDHLFPSTHCRTQGRLDYLYPALLTAPRMHRVTRHVAHRPTPNNTSYHNQESGVTSTPRPQYTQEQQKIMPAAIIAFQC